MGLEILPLNESDRLGCLKGLLTWSPRKRSDVGCSGFVICISPWFFLSNIVTQNHGETVLIYEI